MSGTTSPSAPVAVTRVRSQATRSAERMCIGGLSDRDVRRLLLDYAQERVDDLGIELPRPLTFDLGDGFDDRPRRLVGPLLCERVEDVGDGDDSPGERDLLLLDADVAVAIPALVVAEGDFLRQPQHAKPAARQDARADGSVRLDQL